MNISAPFNNITQQDVFPDIYDHGHCSQSPTPLERPEGHELGSDIRPCMYRY